MTEPSVSTECLDCGQTLSELESADNLEDCPNCGSTRRHHQVVLTDKLSLYECMKGAIWDSTLPSKRKQKRTRIDFMAGNEYSVDREKMIYKEQMIDRRDDEYRELVVDPDTGEVIHECEEPLSQHTGHGSAKQKHKT